jgi:hypothetical protein
MSTRSPMIHVAWLTAAALCLASRHGALATQRDVPATYPTIQAAIDASISGDEVVISPGTYTGTGNRDIDFHGKAITVRSTDPNDPNGVAATVVNARGATSSLHRGFYFHSGESAAAIVSGLTITGGVATSGGAIFSSMASPTVTRCVLVANTATDKGGAFYCEGTYYACPRPTIRDCTIRANTSQWHGAGVFCTYSSATISGCTIVANQSLGIDKHYGVYGGGICFAGGGSSTVSQCILASNMIQSGGGAGVMTGATAAFDNCLVTGNYTNDCGGGLAAYSGGRLNVTNCRVCGNLSAQAGGVLALFTCVVKVTNSDICGNFAAALAGGAGIEECWSDASSVFRNCTIAGNAAAIKAGGVGLLGSRVTLDNCIVCENVDNLAGIDPPRPPMQIGLVEESHPSVMTVTCSDIQGGPNDAMLAGGSTFAWGTGNLDIDPRFTGGPAGVLTADGNYDANTFQVTLTDDSADWPANGLVSRLIQIDTDPPVPIQFPIIANTPTTVTFWALGAMIQSGSSMISAGATYRIRDYHLRMDSPCVNAADPNGNYAGQTDIDGEPRVIDDRADIGSDETPVFQWRVPPDGEWNRCGAGTAGTALMSLGFLACASARRHGRRPRRKR